MPTSGNGVADVRLSGRELCDALFVLAASRRFQGHAEVAQEVAKTLCFHYEEYLPELQLWPQTLPLVSEFLAWYCRDRRLIGTFLRTVLAPFWRKHEVAVQGALVPHHAQAVSAACSSCGRALPHDVLETVRGALCNWTTANVSQLGPRGTAGMALALSRVGPGLAGEDANARLLTMLVRRAGQLLEEAAEGSTKMMRRPLGQKVFKPLTSVQFFRADWLGMFLSALARGRCRDEVETLRRLLEAHLLPRQRSRLAFEAQNLALAANAVLKLDLLQLRLGDSTPLAALAPEVRRACIAMEGDSGARSACLLAHAFGSALVLLPTPPAPGDIVQLTQVYEKVLEDIFELSLSLRLLNIRVRFQLLSAVQCWFFASELGLKASLPSLHRAQRVLEKSGVLPDPVESLGDQDLISTKGHAEVAEALPKEWQARARMEDFAFPFWLDIVVARSSTKTVWAM
ncbi:unnamed protein product [Symbiodinium pilosum]|uniref:Uncharacterized protein n=1 Tax=Symbiodinium pilosum TaxID=2952 RepID=A0A812JPQ8_SYMPI|nr:unnamed protein product [Symbiodinium pilosum]